MFIFLKLNTMKKKTQNFHLHAEEFDYTLVQMLLPKEALHFIYLKFLFSFHILGSFPQAFLLSCSNLWLEYWPHVPR